MGNETTGSNHLHKNNNLDVSTESIEMLIEDEPEEKKIVSRKVVARKPVKMRDFTNEEKGEEVDEIEVKDEEKDKHSKPRGWKTDEEKLSRKSEKREKAKSSKNSDKNTKSNNSRLPTADGSRQSRLDKENAEKDITSKNVWAERAAM